MLCRTRNSADKLLLHFRFLSSAKISPLANFLQELSLRNMIGNTHPVLPYKEKDLKTYASTLPNVLYSGFDPTSNSFHIGNLLVLVTLIRSAIIGCNPIALIGEATVAIGDPSGHTSGMLSKEEIHENVSLLRQQLERIISNARSFNGEHFQFTILNNLDWHKEIKMLDFLASSKRYRMGEMLKTGPVRSRLENGLTLSFSEFAYQVLQSNDWLKLYETHHCLCQIGGSDQLGNLEIGFEHIRAQTGRLSLGICLPLLTDEDGNKLGKSTTEKAGTGFWLNPQRTSHFSFYQYFRQLHDDIAETLLLRFSLRPLGELEEVIKQHKANQGKWIAQTQLADELTYLVHGQEGLQLARRCSDLLFKGSIKELETLDPETIKGLFGAASTFSISKNSLDTVGQLAEMTRPGGAKLMKQGALRINGIRYQDPEQRLALDQLIIHNHFTIVCWGKRKFSLVLWN